MATDGFGNKIETMSYEQFLALARNKAMWCSGDTIQVKNRSDLVICTTVLKDKALAESA